MSAAEVHPLYPIKGKLEEAASSDATAVATAEDILASLLRGAHLPAMGGRDEPADQLFQALSLPPVDPQLPTRLAKTTARLVERRAKSFEEAIEEARSNETDGVPVLTRDEQSPDEAYVYNLLLFASFLPAEASLFQALRRLKELGLVPGSLTGVAERTPRTLLQALIYQQTDASLESYWLAQLQLPDREPNALGDDEISTYLDAWTGLLWIPPSAEAKARGEIVDPDRARRGLEALADRLEGTAEDRTFLRYAVARLDEAYPRDPTYWAEVFDKAFDTWPLSLQTVTAERWPPLVGNKDHPTKARWPRRSGSCR